MFVTIMCSFYKYAFLYIKGDLSQSLAVSWGDFKVLP